MLWILKMAGKKEKTQQMKEREYVEAELTKLLETTLQLENELYSVSE